MIDKVGKFFSELSDDDFFHYLSPFSYYNSGLKASITLKEIVDLSNGENLLKLYFELKDVEEEILEILYDEIQSRLDYDEYEDEQITIGWIPIIIYLLGERIEIYNSIKIDYDEEFSEIINVNESINRKNYWILNPTKESEIPKITFYSKEICEILCEFYDIVEISDIEKLFDSGKLINKKFSIERGGFILNKDIREIVKCPNNNKKCGEIRLICKKLERIKKIENILGENRVYFYGEYILLINSIGS